MADDSKPASKVDYNWHPAVHSRHFEETLYFVMIRLHEPLHRPVAEQVRELLEGAGIKYACAYPLFGWWDALLRIWLAPASYDRFIQVLEEESVKHNVENYKGFTVSKLRYLWHNRDEDLLAPKKQLRSALASNRAAIKAVAEDPEATDTEGWRSLKKAGLVFPRPEMPEGGVKFYTCLERTTEDTMSARREIEAILRAMDATILERSGTPMSERSSLYCGSGTLADYMIRCVADTFEDVLALAESFDKHLKSTDLRPMTLLVANPSAVYESDHVNDIFHLHSDDATTVGLLDFEEEVFAKLPISHRNELNELVAQACEISKDNQSLQDAVLKVIRASALDDHDAFQAALFYLLNFEPEFKGRLKREFSDVFGADWPREIRQLCQEDEKTRKHAEEEMSKDLRDWTLGTYLHTAYAVCGLHPGFRGRMATQLGDEWKVEAEALLDLRNDLSHGRVYEIPRLDVYDAYMVDFLRRAMSAAVFWWKSRNGHEPKGI